MVDTLSFDTKIGPLPEFPIFNVAAPRLSKSVVTSRNLLISSIIRSLESSIELLAFPLFPEDMRAAFILTNSPARTLTATKS